MIQFRNHRKKSVGYFGTIPKNYTKNLIFVSETVRKFNEIFVPLLYLNKITHLYTLMYQPKKILV